MIYNQGFYDLNGKRGYCVDGVPGFPVDVVQDLKVSVPGQKTVRLNSIFVADEAVRLTFTYGGRVAAVFTSDSRSTIRLGEPYALKAIDLQCGGVVVFGPGLTQKDWNLEEAYVVSEECLTRYEPSRISSIGMTCDAVRLTGEVTLGSGDPERLESEEVTLTHLHENVPIATRGLRLRLVDNGLSDVSNPQVAMANGTNGYFGVEGRKSPVFRLFGALPDSTGTVKILFDRNFNFRRVVGSFIEPYSSWLALGSNLTMEDFCAPPTVEVGDPGEPVCPPDGIEFEVIEDE